MLAFGLNKGKEVMEAAGAKKTLAFGPVRNTGWHLMGTTRMGTDPKKSVVNQFGQSHDVKNLFVVDSSVFDDERVHPSWSKSELNKWYACEVSGLNFNDNCIAISTKKTGGRVEVFLDPQTSYVKYDNKVKPISRDTSAVGTYRNKEPNKIVDSFTAFEQMFRRRKIFNAGGSRKERGHLL